MNPVAHSSQSQTNEHPYCARQEKRAKIIATLGPNTATEEMIRDLILAGANIFRLNQSHSKGDVQALEQLIQTIRIVSQSLKRPVGILADLQGPKLRTGLLQDHKPVTLKPGETTLLTASSEPGEPGRITTEALELLKALQADDLVLIDDGRLRLKVSKRIDDHTVECRIIQGGDLKERKGINVPTVSLAFDALTEKDKADALTCVKAGVDFLALSFVRHPEDVIRLRDFVLNRGLLCPPIIAKIEKPQAVDHIDAIIDEADGIMVARGDLGVELPPERVPGVQKMLIHKANCAGKPVIVATQMLESMISSLEPTRAETTDVYNAVFDGADVLMLSGETAVGEHPVQAVAMMTRVIYQAEQEKPIIESPRNYNPDNYHEVIAYQAATTHSNARAIVVLSSSGHMAQRVSKRKPAKEIIALTPDPKVFHQMSLLWGVTPVMIPYGHNSDQTIRNGEMAILKAHLLEPGDGVIFCAGLTPFPGASNFIKLYHMGELTHIT